MTSKAQKNPQQTGQLSKKSVTFLIIVFLLAVVSSAKIVIESSKPKPVDPALARVKGDAAAKVHVTEFMDFQCPMCANGAIFLNKYMKDHPGRIRVELKYFPLESVHANAVRSARYSECAARQGKFWPYHDLLTTRQADWRNVSNADPFFMQLANQVGLDPQKLDQCLSDDEIRKAIFNDKEEGTSLGVRSTPTYFVNGKMVVGPKSLEEELRNHFPESGKPASNPAANQPHPQAPAQPQEVYH